MEERTWFKHYDKGIPSTLQPYPERTLVDVLADSARERPKHPALLFQGKAVTYKELERLTTAFAGALTRLGVRPGERVALLLPNTPHVVVALFGVWKAGAIAVPLNPLYTQHELEHLLKDSGAETAIVLTPFYDKLKALQPHTAIRKVIAAHVKDFLPPATRILFSLFKEKDSGHHITLQAGDRWMADLLRQYRPGGPTPGRAKPADPAILLFSGGTTGTPKAVIGTHRALFIAGTQLHAWIKNLLVDWDDVIMLNMPLFHAYGLVGVFATGLVGHNTFALVPNPRDLDDLLAIIQKVRPAFLPGVPTLFNALLNHAKVKSGEIDLTSVKLCISGAAPLMAETKQRFEKLTGGHIVEAYAMTESMLGATMSPVFGEYKPGSIGLPLPDVEVRITDLETGRDDLATGEVGEILLRAPQLMQGYWNNPDETANILREGWLHTGDIGYQDGDGYVFIVDRKKDLIKPGGFQVWPRPVEEEIAAHPAVADVCVAGIPDAQSGEAVKAWVVLREGEQLNAADLRAYLHDKLAAYKIPKFVEFREDLPKTPVGKINKRKLIAQEKSAAEPVKASSS